MTFSLLAVFLVVVVFFLRQDRKLDMRDRLVVTATVDATSAEEPAFLRQAFGLIRRNSPLRFRLALVTSFTASFFFLNWPLSVTRSPLERRLPLGGVRRVAILPIIFLAEFLLAKTVGTQPP